MHNQKLNSIIAILIGVIPINAVMIWYRLTHAEAFTTFQMLAYPLIFGGANILLILLLNRYLIKGKFRDFNTGKGVWYWDIPIGIALTLVYFLLLGIERPTLSKLLPQGPPPSQEVLNLITNLAQNPVLLAIWLGPVVWIGVAAFEELIRVFFLNCLWKLSEKKAWEVLAIIIVSASIGMVHLYQGSFGIISVGIQSLVMGFYYYRFRRIWPLIISHALYDSVQIILLVQQLN